MLPYGRLRNYVGEFWNLEFPPFGTWNKVVTPTQEVSRFIEFLSRDSSFRRNDILGHELGTRLPIGRFGIWNFPLWNLE